MALNLHRVVRGAIGRVNPAVPGTWRRSAGYTTAADGKQSPFYDDQALPVQEQALSAREIDHLDALNIQGTKRGFWLDGDVQAVNRVTNQGGDLIVVPSGTYLVVEVFETWSQGGWCHVAGVRQRDD